MEKIIVYMKWLEKEELLYCNYTTLFCLTCSKCDVWGPAQSREVDKIQDCVEAD